MKYFEGGCGTVRGNIWKGVRTPRPVTFNILLIFFVLSLREDSNSNARERTNLIAPFIRISSPLMTDDEDIAT